MDVVQPKEHVPIKRRSIFYHGLPEMGPISEATHITSNPSIPTDEQHREAWLKESSFSVLSDLASDLDPDTNIIWSQVLKKMGDLGDFRAKLMSIFCESVFCSMLEVN